MLDGAAKALFNASRFGEWLNQVIPCGAIVVQTLNDPCITGGPAPATASASESTSLSVPTAPALPTKGAAAVTQLLTP